MNGCPQKGTQDKLDSTLGLTRFHYARLTRGDIEMSTESNNAANRKFKNFFSSVSKVTISESAYDYDRETVESLAIAMKRVQ